MCKERKQKKTQKASSGIASLVAAHQTRAGIGVLRRATLQRRAAAHRGWAAQKLSRHAAAVIGIGGGVKRKRKKTCTPVKRNLCL